MNRHPELYPHDDAQTWPDDNGHEWFNSRPAALPAITDADIVAHCTQGPQQPHPAVMAYQGADMDAYWRDGDVWRHCLSGEIWVPPVTLAAATASFCDMLVARNAPGAVRQAAE